MTTTRPQFSFTIFHYIFLPTGNGNLRQGVISIILSKQTNLDLHWIPQNIVCVNKI